MLREQGQDAALSFPTVLAERGKKVVGFVATRPNQKAVIAGPLVVSKELARPGITIIRLGEAYERVLKTAGVRLYWFHVDPHMTEWADILHRVGFEPMQRDDTGLWFRRAIA